MTAHVIYETATGLARSVGTIVAAQLPAGLTDAVITDPEFVGLTNGTKVWDAPTKTVVAAPAVIPELGYTTFCKLTADQAALTATALVNVAGLAFAVMAGLTYRFKFLAVFRSAALTTGLRVGLTCPAFSTFTASAMIPSTADAATAEWAGWITSSGDSVVGPGVQAINTDYLAVVEGVIVPTVSGALQLQAATEVAASNVIVRAGSCGQIWVC